MCAKGKKGPPLFRAVRNAVLLWCQQLLVAAVTLDPATWGLLHLEGPDNIVALCCQGAGLWHFLMIVAFLGHGQLPRRQPWVSQKSLGPSLETEVSVLEPLMNSKTQADPNGLTFFTHPGDTGMGKGPRLPRVWWGPRTVGFR